jgi:hypothetical protein
MLWEAGQAVRQPKCASIATFPLSPLTTFNRSVALPTAYCSFFTLTPLALSSSQGVRYFVKQFVYRKTPGDKLLADGIVNDGFE